MYSFVRRCVRKLGGPLQGERPNVSRGGWYLESETYLHTYIPAYLHTYIPTYLHTCIPTYLGEPPERMERRLLSRVWISGEESDFLGKG